MPHSDDLLEELARRRAEETRQAERDYRRDMILTAVQCLFWMLVGLFCMAWSFHTSDEQLGQIAFLAGIALGNGGILFTLVTLYWRGEKRGDW